MNSPITKFDVFLYFADQLEPLDALEFETACETNDQVRQWFAELTPTDEELEHQALPKAMGKRPPQGRGAAPTFAAWTEGILAADRRGRLPADMPTLHSWSPPAARKASTDREWEPWLPRPRSRRTAATNAEAAAAAKKAVLDPGLRIPAFATAHCIPCRKRPTSRSPSPACWRCTRANPSIRKSSSCSTMPSGRFGTWTCRWPSFSAATVLPASPITTSCRRAGNMPRGF